MHVTDVSYQGCLVGSRCHVEEMLAISNLRFRVKGLYMLQAERVWMSMMCR